MRKFLLFLIIILFQNSAFAFENYIMLSDSKISDIKISNDEVIFIEPIKSIKSEEYSMMIIPKNIGSTRLTFSKGKKRVCLVVKVSDYNTSIRQVNGIKLIPVDLPPELR